MTTTRDPALRNRMIRVLAMQRALASESDALRRDVGPQWSAEAATTIVPEEIDRWRVVVVTGGDPPPSVYNPPEMHGLTAACLAAEATVNHCSSVASDKDTTKLALDAAIAAVGNAGGNLLREALVCAERLRWVLARYIPDVRKVYEELGDDVPELVPAELLGSLLERWAEEREAVKTQGLAALVSRPSPGVEIGQYLERAVFYGEEARAPDVRRDPVGYADAAMRLAAQWCARMRSACKHAGVTLYENLDSKIDGLVAMKSIAEVVEGDPTDPAKVAEAVGDRLCTATDTQRDLEAQLEATRLANLSAESSSSHKPGDTIALWTDLRGTRGLVLTACGRVCVAHPTVGLIWASQRAGSGVGPAAASAWPVRLIALGNFDGDGLETPLVAGLINELEAAHTRVVKLEAEVAELVARDDRRAALVEALGLKPETSWSEAVGLAARMRDIGRVVWLKHPSPGAYGRLQVKLEHLLLEHNTTMCSHDDVGRPGCCICDPDARKTCAQQRADIEAGA